MSLFNSSSHSLYWGYGSAAVSVVFFGSSYVPVKRVDVGDGLVFQFIVCNMFMIIGVAVNVLKSFPQFFPLVMVGGAMTATANLFLPIVIKMIGLGVTTFIFGMFSLFPGWAIGRYGLLGIEEEIPKSIICNYIGIALCAVSGFLYMFVKTNDARRRFSAYNQLMTSSAQHDYNGGIPSYGSTSRNISVEMTDSNPNVNAFDTEDHEESCSCLMNKNLKPFVGSILAAIAGTLSGGAYIPALHVMNNDPDASDDALDYICAHFTGAFAMSSIFFILYCFARRGRPFVNPKSILPAYLSGLLFGVGFVSSFITNAILNPAISFPIITAGPPVVTLLWSLFMFREIEGKRNIILLSIGIAITVVGITLVSLSKAIHTNVI